MPVPEIADRLGRAASTIYREIERNFCHFDDQSELNGYHDVLANDLAQKRHAVHCKVIRHPDLKVAIEDCLGARCAIGKQSIRPSGTLIEGVEIAAKNLLILCLSRRLFCIRNWYGGLALCLGCLLEVQRKPVAIGEDSPGCGGRPVEPICVALKGCRMPLCGRMRVARRAGILRASAGNCPR